MVFWASPNQDSDLSSARRGEAMENIQGFQEDKPFMESLEALEKSMKSSSGGLTCIEGSIYKVPFLKIAAEDECRSVEDPLPAAKKRKTAATPKDKGPATKGKATSILDHMEPKTSSPCTPSNTIVSIPFYPLSDTAINILKKVAEGVEDFDSAASSEGSGEPSTSKGVKGVEGKKGLGTTGQISGRRIGIDNEGEWLEKGLKTPMDKILKTIVDKSIDPKTVGLNLVRMQLVGEEGLAPQLEQSTGNQLGTLLVVLPLKFSGGKISVRHGDETWSIDPAKSKSTVRCSWIAFKAEAEFGVEGVTDGTSQALLVYHIVGDQKNGKSIPVSDEKVVLEKLEAVTQRIKADSPINRLGILLQNKYNPKNFQASLLKGQDRWLYNFLKDSKYEVKLTIVRVLITAWGFFDSRDWPEPENRTKMSECGEEFMESEIWEVNMSKAEKWAPKKQSAEGSSTPPYCSGEDDHHKSRRLPWEMPWLHKSLFSVIPQMTRVDREPRPSWSEGIWLSETYRAAALLVTVKPGFADADDGPYTHFYPVAHPEPRGVSEREDMEWSRPAYMWRLPGETQEELDEIDRRRWNKRNWVHKDLD